MGTVKEFLALVKDVDGVDECLLVKEDGQLLGHMIDDPEKFAALLAIGGKYARDIMGRMGFTYCRFLSFERSGGQTFHIFPVDKYYLGIVQSPEFPLDKMIKRVSYLLSLIKTGGSNDMNKTTNREGQNGASL